jgi:hypothetical protein
MAHTPPKQVTGNYNSKPTIAQRRRQLKYSVNTASTTASGVTPIRGTNRYPDEPSIYFTREAWVKQCHLVKICSKEVGWFALVDYDATDNSFTITDLVIPTQEVTASETDIGKEDLADAAMELIEQGKDTSKMYAWFHSHVDMSVTPSAQDEYQVEDFLEDLADQPEVPAFIRGIQNKKGDLKLDVYYIQHGIAYQNLDFYVIHDDDPQWTKDIDVLVKTRVAERTYQSYGNYGWDTAKKYGGNGVNKPVTNFRSGAAPYPNDDDYNNFYLDSYEDAADERRLGNSYTSVTTMADDSGSDYDYAFLSEIEFSIEEEAQLELVHMSAYDEEVYSHVDGSLYVCDPTGSYYRYDDYVEAFGEVGTSRALATT